MKIAVITDQHLDGRKGSLPFWNFWQKFYDEIFFPTIKREGITTILDLGDTFDNRKSVDFNTLSRIKANYFDRLKNYDVHMILGNHTTYYKNTSKINSPELLLENYKNITIYKNVEELSLGTKKFLMLPWINADNKDISMKMIEESDASIVCGHLEINGFEVTPGMRFDHGGLETSIFKKYDRVWSGHFHHRSKIGNIHYLGNPYQMFWNDYKDQRGFHIYDTELDRLRFIKNPFEIFQKIYYNDIDFDYSNFETEPYKNSFVKIIVEEKRSYTQFEDLIERLYRTGVHDIKIVETLVDTDAIDDVDLNVKDTLTLLSEYIDEIDLSVDKTDLKKLMQSLYIESCEVV
tara:strand:- start:4762 stop:5805 length:1044 start_codon:yes stop_codon:yes gene_type:complete